MSRTFQLTLPKSGSQWVRDVLTDSDIVAFSGMPLSRKAAINAAGDVHPVEEPGFYGPVYYLKLEEWLIRRKHGDRAIVVMRDPRDVLVSLLYSIIYSHSTVATDLPVTQLREYLLSLDMDTRLHRLFPRIARMEGWYKSWSDPAANSAEVLSLRYEDLVEDPVKQFGAIMAWLGWNVPGDVQQQVVDRHSFEVKGRRKMGEEDMFSHLRTGISGDWRKKLSREVGRAFELEFGKLLAATGYEEDRTWWGTLPKIAGSSVPTIIGESEELSAEVEREMRVIYQRRNEFLEIELGKKEKVTQELAEAARLRLADADQLRQQLRLMQSPHEDGAEGVLFPNAQASADELESGAASTHDPNPKPAVDMQTQAPESSPDGRYQLTLGTLERLLKVIEERESLFEMESVVDHHFSGWSKADFVEAIYEKERTVQQLLKAIEAYRAAHMWLNPLSTLSRMRRRLAAPMTPRIGRLHHYNARPVRRIQNTRHTPQADHLPKISIVTPSYQQGHFIEQTISSVLTQGYPNLQYFVQDGGSTDKTVAILEKFEARLSGWESRKDGGQTAALNLGFARTDGDIMGYINSDDLLLPHSLHTVASFFADNPEIDVVYGDRLLVDEDGAEVGNWRLPEHDNDVLSWADYIPQETMFWHRRIWERAGGRFDESFHFAMDWDLILRFRASGAKFKHLPQFLGAFRTHSSQKSSALIHSTGEAEMTRLRQRSLGYVPTKKQISLAVRKYLIRHVIIDFPYRVRDRVQLALSKFARQPESQGN